jgi:hypothetical protein
MVMDDTSLSQPVHYPDYYRPPIESLSEKNIIDYNRRSTRSRGREVDYAKVQEDLRREEKEGRTGDLITLKGEASSSHDTRHRSIWSSKVNYDMIKEGLLIEEKPGRNGHLYAIDKEDSSSYVHPDRANLQDTYKSGATDHVDDDETIEAGVNDGHGKKDRSAQKKLQWQGPKRNRRDRTVKREMNRQEKMAKGNQKKREAEALGLGTTAATDIFDVGRCNLSIAFLCSSRTNITILGISVQGTLSIISFPLPRLPCQQRSPLPWFMHP